MLSVLQNIKINLLQKQKQQFKEQLESQNKVDHDYIYNLQKKLEKVISGELLKAAQQNQDNLKLVILEEIKTKSEVYENGKVEYEYSTIISEIDENSRIKILNNNRTELTKNNFDRCQQLKYLVDIKLNNKYTDVPIEYFEKNDVKSYESALGNENKSFFDTEFTRECGIYAKF